MPGTLFVVATPIGNLEDLTFRALRTLREVDLIAAEDTRRTSKLLAHYEIHKSLVSLREHNEAKQGARLVADLEGGRQIALVTDAGTPGIADPGARFVRLARERGIRVVPIPGCSAITTALSGSGVTGDEFVFAGFAPPGGQLTSWLNDLNKERRTIVFFDTPHSIIRTIGLIESNLVNRHIIVWRELSKVHEQSIELGPQSAQSQLQAKGEFVVVIGPLAEDSAGRERATALAPEATALFEYLTKHPSMDAQSALDMVASRYELTPSDTKKAIKKHNILVKQHKNAAE
jgi:16S rRNA (cytidine1402-2'-O)-methyltransferase